MNAYAGDGTGAADTPTHSANISGSNFGDNTRINQGIIKIFLKSIFLGSMGNPASSPVNNPSGAVQAQLNMKEKIECRRSLSFRDIDARLQNISPVQEGTCDWLFETSQFREWYDPEQGSELLWVKGKPGTGKSTLMKHTLECCQARGVFAIAAYFFNSRGAELEKTPLGMLRSLLFQLLEHVPSLYDPLVPIFRKKQQENSPGSWEWREPELRSFYLSEIPKCQSKPLLFVIDALDECSELEVQNVAEFLQHLSANAIKTGTTLKICLSSRHYPFIHFKRYQELVLENEEQHDKDIVEYISSKLIKRDEVIEEAIREKSSGIFMWVVLVVMMLNKAYDDGRVEAMQQKLDEIPAELGEVFKTLLNCDNPNKDETILILQWVLFAKRLLTPEELYFALIAGTNSQALGIWDPLQITPDIIRRRIISSSRGLIEICKGTRETVQFIHGSVYDFLVRDRRLQKLDPGLMPDLFTQSHDRLKECCLSYLMMEHLEPPNRKENGFSVTSLGYASSDSFPEYSSSEASLEYPPSVSSLGYASNFPFLSYASRYIFEHAEEATSVGQAKFLQILKDNTVFMRVERFHDYFVYKDQFGGPLNLLNVLAARGLPKLVVSVLEGGADINAQGIPHGSALEAAIYYGREKTVETLLSKRAKTDSRGSFIRRTPLKMAFDEGNREILAMLVEKGAKFSTWEKFWHGTVLHTAAMSGDKDVIAMLLDRGTKIDTRRPLCSALFRAATKGEKEIVEMLLERGAKIDTRGLLGTPLMAAAWRGEKEIVELLLKKGANINIQGFMGTSLTAAISGGEIEIVEMLLKKGAKVNAQTFNGSPLSAAAFKGNTEIVKMLLERGAKVNARWLNGSTPLISAASKGNKEIVDMLLKNGAKINTRGLFSTPLIAAASNGNAEIVEMFLKNGAKVNTRTLTGCTPLLAAAVRGNTEIVDMLLKNGAKVNTRTLTGSTPFIVAAVRGNTEIVDMLLKRGAKANTRELFGTPLVMAAYRGNTEIVDMLLKGGAEVDSQKLYRSSTPLMAAVVGGNTEIVDMLLKKGAKIDTQGFCFDSWGGFYGTALHGAVVTGHREIAEMLIEKGANIDARALIGPSHLSFENTNDLREFLEKVLRYMCTMFRQKLYGTPLEAAVALGREEIADLLREKGAKV